MAEVVIIGAGIVVGIVVGYLRGGGVERILANRIHRWGLLVAGVLLQGIGETVDAPGARALVIVGLALLVVGLLSNPHVRGIGITALGLTLNLVVLVLNGAVPVRFEALVEAGRVAEGVTRDQVLSVGHLLELETADTRLAVLGDVIPIAALDTVLSFGDLLVVAGVAVLVQNLMLARRAVGLSVDDVFGPPSTVPVVDLTDDADATIDLRPEPTPSPWGDEPFEWADDRLDLLVDDDTDPPVRVLGPVRHDRSGPR